MFKMTCSIKGNLFALLITILDLQAFDTDILKIIAEMADPSTPELLHVHCLNNASDKTRKMIMTKSRMGMFSHEQNDLFLRDKTCHPLIAFLNKRGILRVELIDMHTYRHFLSENLISRVGNNGCLNNDQYLDILRDVPHPMISYFGKYHLSQWYRVLFSHALHYAPTIETIHKMGLGNEYFDRLYSNEWRAKSTLHN